ncbi:MAG TPA: DUF3341 domain-containing protein [Pirellulales bacterium]
MSCRILVGSFEHEEDLLQAVARVREQGWHINDVYVPYPVHGLDRALGLRPSRLSWAAFVCGALGVAAAIWFQFWTTAVDWPINVGGRPWNSLPAFVPTTFEMMVLFAGLGIVAAFLFVSRLYPGKKPVLSFPGVTDNHFVLVLREGDSTFDADIVEHLLGACHALHSVEREEMETAKCHCDA